MPDRSRRATRTRVAARARARYLAQRIGRALREARTAQGLRQLDVATSAGVSQSFYSRVERGLGTNASIETLAACALACGTQLAAFLEALPGASLPRDIEHLRRQQAVIDLAARGGWRAMPERPIDPDAARSRSIDVLLERPERREVAVVEIVDLLLDAGADIRGITDKVHAMQRVGGEGRRVRGVLVVRATARNRRVLGELASLFASRFPASSTWLSALTRRDVPMPADDGFLWTRATTPELVPARLSPRRRTG